MKKIYAYPVICLFLACMGLIASCEREVDELELATNPTTPEVFIDAFSAGLNYAAFGGSDVRAFQGRYRREIRGHGFNAHCSARF